MTGDVTGSVLRLSRSAYDDIVHQGYDGGDEEVCGVLAGEHGDTESVVREVHRATNVADEPQVRYAMDPEEQFEIIERVEADGMAVVGFYHSHPAGPVQPSRTDVDRATWPGYSYAICAFDGYPYLGSWRWTGETFERETVALFAD
ncbi:desampylase [Haloplanus salinarum]|uniref:desampylase n=1 Tax=Haloplanus salinarum TaxID=1912324 RepID=UPI00214CBC70|nr:desampylase [Haloplanus salinarum]